MVARSSLYYGTLETVQFNRDYGQAVFGHSNPLFGFNSRREYFFGGLTLVAKCSFVVGW